MNARHRTAGFKIRFLGWLLFAAVVGGASHPAQAQDTELSGLVFADYYWVAASHNEALEDRNGFWFRRIYLTLDHTFDEQWSMRVRGEMDQPGDFTSDDDMVPTVKDAYLQWTSGPHTVQLGLTAPPTFKLLEEVWGYRSIEKTPLDLYGFGSSRDIGLSVQGRFGDATPVRYHAMVANGSGTGTETNKGKKAMLSLAVSPLSFLTAEVYGDVEDTGRGEYYTMQGALYYRSATGRAGIQYAHQARPRESGSHAGFDLFSVFGRVRLSNAVNAFARFDRQFQPNPAGEGIDYLSMANNAKTNFLVGGLDFAVGDHARIMPNVEAVFYDDAIGPTPGADVVPRLTLYYWF